jgi:uncharacterized RDD family membrane protein YckC
LSTPVGQVELSPEWKLEVNRRVAAHKSRHRLATEPETSAGAQPAAGEKGSQVAAQVAARVAARYAKAPSYGQLLAGETRAAVRATQPASVAISPPAPEAQPAPQPVLVGLEELSGVEPAGQTALSLRVQEKTGGETGHEPIGNGVGHLSPDFGLPALAARQSLPMAETVSWHSGTVPDLAAESAAHESAISGIPAQSRRKDGWPERGAKNLVSAEPGQVPQSPQANLIEFPRELVATRKLRPRLADGPYAAIPEPGTQLSIFEVDPGGISMESEAETAAGGAMPGRQGPEWTGIELAAQPVEQPRKRPARVAAAVAAERELEPAPMNRRLMAAVVDGALIAGAFLASAAAAMYTLKELPETGDIELGAAAALLLASVLYQVLFLALGEATPGMHYARIALRTLDDEKPTRARRCGRLGALALSLAPVGLGFAWALFDAQHLSWHDRLSGCYLRKS